MLTTVRHIFGRIMHSETALCSQWDKGWKNNLLFASPSIRRPTSYTGDVEKADPVFDCGCLTLRPKQVFLSRMDSGAVFDAIRQKIHSGIVLTDDDLMKLVVLPLSVPGPERKTQLFEKISSLAGEIPDETQRNFVLSAMALATEKFIDRE